MHSNNSPVISNSNGSPDESLNYLLNNSSTNSQNNTPKNTLNNSLSESDINLLNDEQTNIQPILQRSTNIQDLQNPTVYENHAKIFNTIEHKLFKMLNADITHPSNNRCSGYIESLLISWNKRTRQNDYEENDNICIKTMISFDKHSQWHCEICCFNGKCNVLNINEFCHDCSYYTLVAQDKRLQQIVNSSETKSLGIYDYIWKTQQFCFAIEQYFVT